MDKIVVAIFCVYIAAFVVTFGHSAANYEFETRVAQCVERPYSSQHSCTIDSNIGKVSVSILAGVLWPLYWSWEAWS
jgi:hypothetical protein